MNMASAVENDVWCYLVDNPNLLTGTTNPSPCIPSCGDNMIDIWSMFLKLRDDVPHHCIRTNLPSFWVTKESLKKESFELESFEHSFLLLEFLDPSNTS
jgi:hypothetical protein